MKRDAYDPLLYSLVHRGSPGDADFYAQACRGSRNVLELGCGYGRLMQPLLRAGARASRYQGLDLSLGLLALAAQHRRELPSSLRARASLRLGDMRDFSFRTRFDRILIAHSTLYCLRSDADVLRCLRCARQHLTPDGEVLLDAYAADRFHADADPDELMGQHRDRVARVEADGTRYQVFERTRWQRARQRLLVTYEYEARGERPIIGRILHRYLLREQLTSLLTRAGFADLTLYGSFAGAKLTRSSTQLIVRAR